MDKDKLPTIPTPTSQRWREFRIQVLPFFVFVGILAVIGYLWNNYVQPVGLIGVAETESVDVTSPQDGILAELHVDRFQDVTAGTVVAVVINTTPELAKAQIAKAKAELEVMRERLSVDRLGNDERYQQFRLSWLEAKATQGAETAQFFEISNNFYRASLLLYTETNATQQITNLVPSTNSLISLQAYDAAKARLDVAVVTLTARAEIIADLEAKLEQLRPSGGEKTAPDSVSAAIEATVRELELSLQPVHLKAAISGMVTKVSHLPGERVLRGTPIVSISAHDAKHIVGYLRQPLGELPKTNDAVQVLTRTWPRQVGTARVLAVGTRMEPIDPLLLSADSKRLEAGLPIQISIPDNLNYRLTPGEPVNLIIGSPKPAKP